MTRGVKVVLALGIGVALCLGPVVVGFLSGSVSSADAADQVESAIVLEPCQLSAPGSPVRVPAKCGTLTVYEDREAQAGRRIDLRVAVVKAVRGNPAPDPLFLLTGGPGQAATQSYLSLAPALDRIREKRDIVLVDQRGTGQSNPLQCAQLWDLDEQTGTSGAGIQSVLKACLDGLDADSRLYTTPIAMDDLDQVRQALGYQKVNLYGVSYGTRAALSYLRQYPDRVRTVILDGVWPLGLSLSPMAAANAQRAIDMMFDRCAVDAACADAFPNLRAEFADLLNRLKQGPARVELNHPITAEPMEFDFTYEQFASGVRLLTYSPETEALLPMLIHGAYSTGDFRLLAAQSLMVGEQLSDSISLGMGYSVMCAEDLPFSSREDSEAAVDGSYLGTVVADALFEACAVWPRGAVSGDFNSPVDSDTPVLMLSGEADPVTPPSNAEFAARTLPRSLHLVAPGQGHNVLFRGCLSRVAASFVESGTTEGLDTGCVREIVPMPFFANPAGPPP